MVLGSIPPAHLVQVANHEYRKSETMLSLAHALACATLDVRRLSAQVINSAKELTSSDRCSLFIVNEGKQQLEAPLPIPYHPPSTPPPPSA